MFAITLSLLMAINLAAAPKVYKCVDVNGTTIFSSNPCNANPEKVTEVDTSRALLHGDAPAVKDISDSVAISGIDHNCKMQQSSVERDGEIEISGYQNKINALKSSERGYNNNAAGAAMISATETRIASLENQKNAAESRLDARVSQLGEECRKAREAELKRQSGEKHNL